ncbi:Coatomer subunit delta [Thalictrum thalictroides]|uniref:Coatomer subunit delta n=1 Tax=Thalictrum thalictroides TaxID=46969 RepID=A0A7J6VLJ0_THATH|nr:Coatomer subunit delta [Thalictrum thalictroides]
MEDLYLVLITNKQSNILEDLETLRLLSKLVSEHTPSLDKEGIISSFDIVFEFDEVISLGHKEIVNVAQVKHYCEMESHEEKLYNLARQSKINETKEVMKRKACEIDKSKIDKKRGDNGGFISVQSMGSGRIENSFDLDFLSSKSTGGDPPAAAAKPSKGGMKLGTTKRTNHILQSLQAEGFAMEC